MAKRKQKNQIFKTKSEAIEAFCRSLGIVCSQVADQIVCKDTADAMRHTQLAAMQLPCVVHEKGKKVEGVDFGNTYSGITTIIASIPEDQKSSLEKEVSRLKKSWNYLLEKKGGSRKYILAESL